MAEAPLTTPEKFARFAEASGVPMATARAQVESFAATLAQALPAMKRGCEALSRAHVAARVRPCGCLVHQVTNVDPYGLAQSA